MGQEVGGAGLDELLALPPPLFSAHTRSGCKCRERIYPRYSIALLASQSFDGSQSPVPGYSPPDASAQEQSPFHMVIFLHVPTSGHLVLIRY